MNVTYIISRCIMKKIFDIKSLIFIFLLVSILVTSYSNYKKTEKLEEETLALKKEISIAKTNFDTFFYSISEMRLSFAIMWNHIAAADHISPAIVSSAMMELLLQSNYEHVVNMVIHPEKPASVLINGVELVEIKSISSFLKEWEEDGYHFMGSFDPKKKEPLFIVEGYTNEKSDKFKINETMLDIFNQIQLSGFRKIFIKSY